MNDKIVGICESAFGLAPTIISENSKELESIEQLSESERQLMGYSIDKVAVHSDGTDYFVEYTGNLEKYIKDNSIGLNEAIENLCEEHDLLKDSIVLVVDESCIDKMDIAALKEAYNVKRV